MTRSQPLLGLAADRIGNPHHVDDRVDHVLPVRRDVQGYSETAVLTTWSPASSTGLFIHVGRCPQDVDLWYAQTIAYLPDGRLAVDRSCGRAEAPHLVQTGNFRLHMGDSAGAWHSTFDGAAELCTPLQMARRPTGSGAVRPMRWQLECEAAGPLYDLYAGRAHREDFAQGTHTQQVMRVAGELWVDGERHSLDGIAANDHSSGPRSLRSFGSHHWLIGAFPGSTFHCVTISTPDGEPLLDTGVQFFEGDRHAVTRLSEVSPLTRLDAHEPVLTGLLTRDDGGQERVRFDLLHYCPVTLTMQNDNVNGIDWDTPDDDLVVWEAKVRITRENGEIGYAHLERSNRKPRLSRP